MCGIAGFVGEINNPVNCLNEMITSLNHRGPDDNGIWLDNNKVIGLAHARLSILDLSSAGHQPMHSISRRYTILFNGEIYNHDDIRTELENHIHISWIGHSDTETLLACIEYWGLDETLKKLKGMFAIALWDNHARDLTLVRDRVGEKPLFYGWVGGKFVFASELKAIKKFPKFDNEIDKDSLSLFLRFNSIPSPYSIYKNIYKLEAGHALKFNIETKEFKKYCYWSAQEVYKNSHNNKFAGSPSDAVNKLEDVLSKAVLSQMHADVPLGAFLSGGIDSSSIVALMQSQSNKSINTFSIGFDSKENNEAEHARIIANHLGTCHSDMYVSENDALNVIPKLPLIYDEPFADSSQIPTYLVSSIAKQKVTVALSGDAGDELFGGYNRYLFTKKIYRNYDRVPSIIRSLTRRTILSLSEERWDKILGGFFGETYANIGNKLYKAANLSSAKSIQDLHFKLASQIQNPSDWLHHSTEHKTIFSENIESLKELNPIEYMMLHDLLIYLPTDILTKVDRAAMAVSLETRIPFLDPSVIEFAASLPLEMKIRNGITKWPLREVLYRHVPKSLIERPKMGFSIPLNEWLRGPLKDWAESLLNENKLHQEGFLDEKYVRDRWNEHINGKYNWGHQLWNILMFQSWLDHTKN